MLLTEKRIRERAKNEEKTKKEEKAHESGWSKS